jgi:LPS-assembly lipoprotein
MRWRDNRAFWSRLIRLPIVVTAAALVAGCFQPLYGERTAAGGPGLRESLSAIDVAQIDAPANSSEARLAVQIKNDLLFGFTGGGAPPSPTHKLIVKIGGGRSIVAIDRTSALPNLENYGLTATYTLTEIATGRVVITGRASTSVSYDTLGQQRFARISGMHDAERRAAKVISENITTRLASYFVAGT